MMKQRNIKNSSFYSEYDGKKDKNLTIKTTDSFNKALAKHLKDKYPNEKNKQGKHNFSKCCRLLLENYLNLQCTSRKTYNYKIVLIVGDNHLGTENISPYNIIKNKWDETFYPGASQRLCWEVDEKKLTEKYNESDLIKIGNLVDDHKSKFDCDKVYVVSMQLNNYFDKYNGGVYTIDNENKEMHRGLNLLTTKDKLYCIVYNWFIDQDYKPIIKSIGFKDYEQTIRDLYYVNEKAYLIFDGLISLYNKKFPKDFIERLKKKKENYLKDIEKCKDRIKTLQKGIDKIDSKLDEFTK